METWYSIGGEVMEIRITITQLQKACACSEAIKKFKQLYGDQHTFECSFAAQLQFLRESPLKQYWGWAVKHQLIPAWSMQSANLQNADLQGADLQNANLRNADLWNANLQDINLRNANLWNANLRDAKKRIIK